MKDRVLITGAAGFLGSHLAEKLHSEGAEVIGIDNLESGAFRNLSSLQDSEGFSFIKGDVRNAEVLSNVFRDVDTVFHFAAQPSVPSSTENPPRSFEINVRGTFNVLEQARKKEVERVIFASSSAVYGEADILPTPESCTLAPISNYGAEKAAGESYCSPYSHLYGMKTASLRYFNIYGPKSRKGVMFDFLKKLQKDSTELEILGTGEQKKDYLYVEDALNATLLVASKGELEGEAYNVGSGESYTVKEVAQKLFHILGVDPKVRCTGGLSWRGDVQRTHADISRLKELGFQQKVRMDEGLERLVSWFLEYGDIGGEFC